MRIATLQFNGPNKASSQAIPDAVLSPSRGKKCAPAAPRTVLFGLLLLGLVLGLGACQPGSDAGAAASDSASDSASGAADTVSEASLGRSNSSAGASADADSNAASDGASNMLDNDQKKASYAFGFGVIRQVTSQYPDSIDHDAFVAGVRAQLEGRESEVSQVDAQRAVAALTETQRAKNQLAASSAAKEGAKFLADNASKEGVVTTSTGLQYLVLTEGEGAKPLATDSVRTHYEGTFINGEVFDSSVARGEPATFPLNGVIRGWTEALQLMSTGSKYRLFIPPELAYGNDGNGSIPGQSTLIFEVELLEILGSDAS